MADVGPVELDIVVRDDASEQLGKVTESVDQLEKRSPVTVDADTAPARHALDDLADEHPKIDVDTSAIDGMFADTRAQLERLDQTTVDISPDTGGLHALGAAAKESAGEVVSAAGDAVASIDALPPAAQQAAGAVGGIAQAASDLGPAVAAGVGIASAAMFAFEQGAQNAKDRADALNGSISDLGKVSDEALGQMAVNAWAQMGARALLDGKNLQDQLHQLAETNTEGARRMLDHAAAIGLNADAQKMLRQAIADVDAEAAQAKKTHDQYGDAAAAAAGKTDQLTAATEASAGAADAARRSTHDWIAELARIPAEKRAEIVAAIDRGDLAAAEAALNQAARDRVATIFVRTAGVGAALGTLGSLAANVTVNLPAGARGVDALREVTGAARRAGTRYGSAAMSRAGR